MKRAWAMLGGLTLLLAVGCTANYDYRMEQTLDHMAYEKRLNDNLTPAEEKGKLQELLIYVRPPKDLAGPTQAFQMGVVEPGRFDVESSFIEPEVQSLHILARVDRPKAAAKKGAAPVAADAVPRGDFNEEVVELVRSVYGAEVSLAQFKEVSKAKNTFKRHILDLNAKKVEIYLYDGKSKNTPHKVALIFEYPKDQENAVSPKIGLCLECFAVGEAARIAFSGGSVEEGGEGGGGEGEGDAGGGGGPPI
jgi:hypothetical protein